MFGRRAALRRIGAAALALGASGLWRPAPVRSAQPKDKLLRAERSELGTTLWLELEHGPFPCSGESWKDATTVVFVPRHYRARRSRVDTLLHFHGHGETVDRALRGCVLREQLHDSLQNAILVVPQGPVNADDSGGGKLDRRGGLLRFLTEVRETLQTRPVREKLGPAAIARGARIGTLVVSAHSGGYRVAARCLQHGGYEVSELYLFDALYGDVATFRDWIAARKRVRDRRRIHKLVDFYTTGQTADNSRKLMAELDRLGIAYLRETDTKRLTRRQLVRARAVFVETRLGHRSVTFRDNSLRDCLYASRFQRLVKTDWFRARDRPRSIDVRKP